MKVKDVVEKLDLKVLAGENGLNKEVKGVYINDLLSWVMSHGNNDNIWITVQIHPNVIAVAVLNEFSCILVPEGIEAERVTVEKANSEAIPILQSKLNGYQLCLELGKLDI